MNNNAAIIIINPNNPSQKLIFPSTMIGTRFTTVSATEAEAMIQAIRAGESWIQSDARKIYKAAHQISDADLAAIHNTARSLSGIVRAKGWKQKVLKQGQVLDRWGIKHTVDWVFESISPDGKITLISSAYDFKMTKEDFSETQKAINSGVSHTTKAAAQALEFQGSRIEGFDRYFTQFFK